MDEDLSHFDVAGRAKMVDVSDKDITVRQATAQGRVVFARDTYKQIRDGGSKKGKIGPIAELAGIMGTKRTADLIPLCHPLPLSGVNVEVTHDDAGNAFIVMATVKTSGKTGVEMEALTGVSVACLTIYDMAKAIDKSITIESIRLLKKSGGKSGEFVAKN